MGACGSIKHGRAADVASFVAFYFSRIFLHFREEKGRPSFLKKRSKKLLCLLVGAEDKSATAIKSFWFFFSKKNISYLLCH
jgi:hypothetical protein